MLERLSELNGYMLTDEEEIVSFLMYQYSNVLDTSSFSLFYFKIFEKKARS